MCKQQMKARQRVKTSCLRKRWKCGQVLLQRKGTKPLGKSVITKSYYSSCFLQSEDKKLTGITITGRNSLHMACDVKCQLETVQKIIRDSPEYVAARDNVGRLPLHVAAARGASPEVIQFLMKEYPSGALMQDARGKTPLHLACENIHHQHVLGHQLDVIKLICHAKPKSMSMKDAEGRIPLQCVM